ncbi:MAG: sugar ABC transporter permease [Rhodobacteraceae bacterium CG17_big_fil_post_rev_8_21_14_2_50_65_11]|nr:MAG: sugar ABC transporter permease [Rhodobacteraceae bacterium CG17_big_fil_post_rev_8_21_14_2_50_65_11]
MAFFTDTDGTKPLKSVRLRPRFTSLRSIGALILREMNTTYGRSPGGYLWAVLQPLGGILLMVAIFSTGFRSPPLGSNFAIFYATGLLPYFLFLDVSGKLGMSLGFSRQLLAYPRITFMDTIIARFVLNTLTQLLVSYLILYAILALFETRTTLEVDRILMGYAMAISLAIGFGVMNCFLMAKFPVWQQVWGIVTRPLVLVSGIIFLYDGIPEPYRGYLWYNPLMHVTGEMRGAFYVSYEASYVDPGYVFGLSLVLTVFGLLFLRRYHKDIIYS